MRSLTEVEWREEAIARFGPDSMNWRFVCPSCGYVAPVSEWRDVGAREGEVAFSCVGRHKSGAKPIFSKPGPCNYAGGGLFQLNPVTVITESGAIQVFEFEGAA